MTDGQEGARRRGKRGYHHGDLKNALVDAARTLISEKGPMGFTIAEAARLAGVSPSAPYRHFKDRDALVREIARVGYAQFADALEAARRNPTLTPLQALDAVGRAYLAFARDEPAAFAAMFEAGVSLDDDPELRAAADRAYGSLQLAVEAIFLQVPPERRPPIGMVSNHMSGRSPTASPRSFGRADEGRRRAPMTAEDMLEAGVGDLPERTWGDPRNLARACAGEPAKPCPSLAVAEPLGGRLLHRDKWLQLFPDSLS